MRIALIGQSAFGKSVLEALIEKGEDEIVGVFAPPTKEGRSPDPISTAAAELNVPVFEFNRLRDQDAVDQFKALEPELCVMAFVTDIVPMSMINFPSLGTIQYHPSLLPLHRGPSSINWPIIFGKTQTGLSIFWPDEGLDTGPILLQKEVEIGPDDTLGSLYFNHLFPMGVAAMTEAVDLVRAETAPRIEQDPSGGSYEGWCTPDDVRIDWHQDVDQIYNMIRGANPQPGAWTTFAGKRLTVLGSSKSDNTDGDPGAVIAADASGITVGDRKSVV